MHIGGGCTGEEKVVTVLVGMNWEQFVLSLLSVHLLNSEQITAFQIGSCHGTSSSPYCLRGLFSNYLITV